MKKASIKGIEEMMKLLPPGWTLELITPNEKLRIVKPPLSPPQPEPEKPRTFKSVVIIYSPTVGYFYSLKRVNEAVKKDEKIASVLVLGIETEIFSPVNGIIMKVLNENGKPIEYSQPIFQIGI